MKILLSGGGTGGHIYPALALRKAILKKYPDAQFLYIGTERGLESRLVPREGIVFQTINIQGFKRSLSLHNIQTVHLMFQAVSSAKKMIKAFQPDVVIGTGGYVCGPVLYAAAKLGIPTVIHEQNSVAVITNKFLSRYVDKICICFEEARKDFAKFANKVVLTGNPRGEELAEVTVTTDVLAEYGLDELKPTVLVFGGSRGAPALNDSVFEAYEQFANKPYQVLAATGEAHYQEFVRSNRQPLRNVAIVPYIDNMLALLSKVDLVVCRSGATTLTEITALGVASILVPSPYVTNNHQQKNAQTLVDAHAAKMIVQADLTGASLVRAIDQLMTGGEQLWLMGQQAKKLGITDAAQRMLRVIETLSHKGGANEAQTRE